MARTVASSLASAVLEALRDDPVARDELRVLLGVDATPAPTSEDGWLSTRAAAAYLGLTTAALHRLTSARAIPFEQDGPNCRCWFRRSELDAWRRGESSNAERRST